MCCGSGPAQQQYVPPGQLLAATANYAPRRPPEPASSRTEPLNGTALGMVPERETKHPAYGHPPRVHTIDLSEFHA
ncbi:hypothetical protein GCM10010211_52990 [Streptomyces albospinus]|uniref:Uncharacterized protein n=1 Tax=Streptomyces albospinus TaxID=285515 RepID=A0ABQ2VEU9_9ACTN|nr:hypothetical protein GCM10010211_52990 [Streptomyces albospinus]